MSEVEKKKESKNLEVAKRHEGKLMLLSKNAVCNSKQSRFTQKQETSGLLSGLRLKISLSKIPILSDIFFKDIE